MASISSSAFPDISRMESRVASRTSATDINAAHKQNATKMSTRTDRRRLNFRITYSPKKLHKICVENVFVGTIVYCDRGLHDN